jgi:hypothetical protein
MYGGYDPTRDRFNNEAAVVREWQKCPLSVRHTVRVPVLAGVETYVEENGSGPIVFYLHGATEWIGYAGSSLGCWRAGFG